MPIDLKVPAVGESVSEIFIGQWYKAEGDRVQADEGLVEVESEKATLDIPSPAGGVLVKILKKTGEAAEIGEVIAQIDPAGGGPPRAPGEVDGAKQAGPVAPTGEGQRPMPKADSSPSPAPAGGPSIPTSPREKWIIRQEPSPSSPAGPAAPASPAAADQDAAGHLAGAPSESGAVVARPARPEPAPPAPAAPVAPSPLQHVHESMVQPTTRQTVPPLAAVAWDSHREEEAVPLSPIRRRIAARLVEAQHNAALLTTFNEIDMTAVKALRAEFGEAFQKRHGVKLGFMSFFVKAAIEALRQCPEINAVIEGDSIVYRRYYDIGVAIGSQRGLVVPVLRNAERMTFAQVERSIDDFAKRAQANALRVDDLQGGTFTISNGGVYGSLLSTPIVNPPQSGVLGMHAIQDRPAAVEGHVEIRPMMYVALSYDHRVVDGREAVTFLRRIKEVVEAPTRVLLEV